MVEGQKLFPRKSKGFSHWDRQYTDARPGITKSDGGEANKFLCHPEIADMVLA